MISTEKEQRIRELLNAQVTIRQIARQLKVGRNQIAKIARDERPDYAELRRLKKLKRAQEAAARKQPPKRCPSCGCMVFMPCVLCRSIAERKERKIKPIQPTLLPIGLQLKPTHHKRYQQVAAAKQRRVAQAQAVAERRLQHIRAAKTLPFSIIHEEP